MSCDWNGVCNVERHGQVPNHYGAAVEKALKREVDEFGICSFVGMESSHDVGAELEKSSLNDHVNALIMVTQRTGKATFNYKVKQWTSVGKDLALARMGVSAHIDDNAEICDACDRIGIKAYRIRTRSELHKSHVSFAGLPAALAQLCLDIQQMPHRFEKKGATFNAIDKYKAERGYGWHLEGRDWDDTKAHGKKEKN